MRFENLNFIIHGFHTDTKFRVLSKGGWLEPCNYAGYDVFQYETEKRDIMPQDIEDFEIIDAADNDQGDE